MIVGLDSDDIGVFERNLTFLQETGIGALQLAILTPQPGTPLRKEFAEQGRIIDNNWTHYDYRHTVIQRYIILPIYPKCCGLQDLYNGFCPAAGRNMFDFVSREGARRPVLRR